MKLRYLLALILLIASNGYSSLRSTLSSLRLIPSTIQPIAITAGPPANPTRPFHSAKKSDSFISFQMKSLDIEQAFEKSLFSLPGMENSDTRLLFDYCFADKRVSHVSLLSAEVFYKVSRPIDPSWKNTIWTPTIAVDWWDDLGIDRSVLQELLAAEGDDDPTKTLIIAFYDQRSKNICIQLKKSKEDPIHRNGEPEE